MITKALKKIFNKLNRSKTNLMIAVEIESIDVIEKILRTCNSHEELFRIDNEGRTVLFYAAARGDSEIIWALLQKLPGTGICCARGSLLNKKDKNGDLAEDFAEIHGNEKAKQLLLHERIRIEYYE